MIKRIHARLDRPETGWDPVPAAHAAECGAHEWRRIDHAMPDELEAAVGGLRGKRILDLGGGPAHYTVSLTQRGGLVTWHDISRNYLQMGRCKAAERDVEAAVRFSLGYLHDAPRLLGERYNLVFDRICWYYALDDASFARVVHELVAPGGWGYVDTTNSSYGRDKLSASARLRTWLNDRTGVKIGYLMPPRGKLARLFPGTPVQRRTVDHRTPGNDRVHFQKAGAD